LLYFPRLSAAQTVRAYETVRDPSSEHEVHHLFSGHGLTLATAESCTGGLVSFRITSVPGSSDYFLGGIVAYSNDLKQSLLGVAEETLERFGAVSEQCALEMAAGARHATGARCAIATTGIAGPGGATARKPVGLIYIACATPLRMACTEVRWKQDRAANMRDAAELALQTLIDETRRYLGESGNSDTGQTGEPFDAS
jgi:PncC family amidohydrolase